LPARTCPNFSLPLIVERAGWHSVISDCELRFARTVQFAKLTGGSREGFWLFLPEREHPTLADAILDRLVHNAYKITLKGESMRKRPTTVKEEVSVT
jgi:hypothetical protein